MRKPRTAPSRCACGTGAGWPPLPAEEVAAHMDAQVEARAPVLWS
ncbi:hypothetical protein JOF41_001543 [Saccharothrix coeruleofusca]|nr:hypothetical protein [Saccharothrix coeruleofusca]